MAKSFPITKTHLVCLSLAVVTVLCYWQVQECAFVDFDDNIYVTENHTVQEGLTLKGVRWAFTFTDDTYWHPLTWLSHMLDCEFFGLDAGRHHLTNLLLHLANSLVLFLVLRRMTGALWRSAFVGVVFAVHPVHVESVAWVTERKDVLSTFFWLLTMGSYVWYVGRPGVRRYLLVLILFVLGLMSKPMVVTLPFVLLLMDYWPLGRVPLDQGGKGESWSVVKPLIVRLVREKIPFFIFSAFSICVSQVSLQRYRGTEISTEMVPVVLRIENALVSYVKYIGKILWPQDLAVFYPYPAEVPEWQTVGSLLVLAGISFLIVWGVRKRPYCAVGWLWYVGTLLPAIGIVQAGLWPGIADRFVYIPSIGLSIAIVWGIADLMGRWRYQQVAVAVLAVIVFAGFTAYTRRQVSYWKDTTSLFQHALKVTDNNYFAHGCLGFVLMQQGKLDEATSQYAEALRINPNHAEVHNNLGLALEKQEKPEEALNHYTEALRIMPSFAEAYYNAGSILARQGKLEEAFSYLSEALSIKPNFAKAHFNLGMLSKLQSKLDEAILHYTEALRLNPDHEKAHYNLGLVFEAQGRSKEALVHYNEALRIEPDLAEAHYSLGTIFSQQGKLDEARFHLSEAVRINPTYAEAHLNLGITLGRQGKLEEASFHLRKAVRTNPDYAKAHNNLGVVLRLQGKPDDALHHFREAVRIEPGYTDARNNLEICLQEKGKKEAVR